MVFPRSFSALVAASSVLQSAVAATVPIVSCSVTQPQLFTNPSFEEGSLAGWTVTDSSANAVVVDATSSSSPFSTAADGQYYIETYNSAIRGADALFLRQTLAGLDTSTTYTITYSIAGKPNGQNSQTCYVYIFKDSQTNANLLVEDVVVMGADGLPWTQYSIDFTPTATSHLILFVPECYQTEYIVGFDNFQFLEPATTACSTSYSTVAASTPSSLPSSQAVTITSSSSSAVLTTAASTSTPNSASLSKPVSSSIAVPSSAAVTSAASSTSAVASSSSTPTPSSTTVSSETAPITTDTPEPDDDEDDGCPA